MTALQTLLSHFTRIPSQLLCAAKTPLLEKSNKQKRFDLAKKQESWTLDQWTSALWSGEAKLEISNQYGQAWDGPQRDKARGHFEESKSFFTLYFHMCIFIRFILQLHSTMWVTDLWLGGRDDFALCADFGVSFAWKTQRVVLDDTWKGLEAFVDRQRHGCGRHFTDDLIV